MPLLCLNACRKTKTEIPSVSRQRVFITLPFYGIFSIFMRKQMRRILTCAYPQIDFIFAFRTVMCLQNCFHVKDRFPIELASHPMLYIAMLVTAVMQFISVKPIVILVHGGVNILEYLYVLENRNSPILNLPFFSIVEKLAIIYWIEIFLLSIVRPTIFLRA